MAKKRSTPIADRTGARRPTALTLKGTPEWRAWLERLAARHRMNVSTLVDVAVAEFAERHRDEQPPPR